MSILHPRVARRKFPQLVEEFAAAQAASSDPWHLLDAVFPHLRLRILNLRGEPCVGLLVNAQNWNHRPSSVTLMDRDFTRYLSVSEVPLHKDATGQTHVYLRAPGDRVWFCVPGTDEYHSSHNAGIPWEAVRKFPEYTPRQTVLRCVERLDRARLTPVTKDGKPAANNIVPPPMQRWMPHGP